MVAVNAFIHLLFYVGRYYIVVSSPPLIKAKYNMLFLFTVKYFMTRVILTLHVFRKEQEHACF